MAIIGWLFCLAAALFLTFATYAAVKVSVGFAGRLSLEALIPFCLAIVFWYFTIWNAPFTVVIN